MDPYDLEPVDSENGSSAHTPVTPHAQGPGGNGVVESGYWCGGCGYSLDGLPVEGQCPECGLPVRQSLAGDLLRDAGPAYVQSLQRGATLVLVSLIASAAIGLLGVLVGIGFIGWSAAAAGAGGGAPGPAMAWLSVFQTIMGLVGVAFGVVGLIGWWKLSTPDPRHGPTQQGSARQVVRVSVTVATVINLSNVVLQPFSGTGVMATPSSWFMIIVIGFGILSLAASATMFFAAMLYIKGLAVRIPDETLETRARTFIWLLPLIYVLGSCIVIGPIVAFVMYAWLINRVRIDMNAVLKNQALRSAITAEHPGESFA